MGETMYRIQGRITAKALLLSVALTGAMALAGCMTSETGEATGSGAGSGNAEKAATTEGGKAANGTEEVRIKTASASSDFCEVTTTDGHNACEEGHNHGDSAAKEAAPAKASGGGQSASAGGGDPSMAIGAFAAIASLALAGDGNFAGASAVLEAATPLLESSGSGDGSCTPGPRCERARSDVQAKLARWEREMNGAGVGRLSGYAYCGAEATRAAAQLCADELSASGNASCAATLEANARDAAGKAEEALRTGREVGVDARQTGPCAG